MGEIWGVTGVSGYIGSRLCEQLQADDAVERIIGVDVRRPPADFSKLEMHLRDVSDPFDDLFAGVDVAVHLAWVLEPDRDTRRMTRVNLGGSLSFLRACERGGAARVVAMSSATAYGAAADNPVPLPESYPIRCDQPFQYAREKAIMEGLVRQWAEFHPQATTLIVRPSIVIGPHVDNYISRTLSRPLVPMIGGADPPMQFVHEDDLARALYELARRGPQGTYNLGGDGTLRSSEVAEILGARVIPLPGPAVHAVTWLDWKLRLGLVVESPPDLLDFIRYPWVVDNRRAKAAIDFKYAFDTAATLRAYRDAR